MNEDVKLSMKVQKLNRLIESRYGLDLMPYVGQPEHIESVNVHFRERYELIKKILGENVLMFDAEATKAYLISEAARMLLHEIAPKRIKKRKG